MSSAATHPGAPFGVMARGAFLPSLVVGLAVGGILVAFRGPHALAGSALGIAVAAAFFLSGMLLLSSLVRSANPYAFLAVAMAVYLGQLIGLVLFYLAFGRASWVDGTALGICALAVTLAWQVFAFVALRRAKLPVYDEAGTAA